MAKAGPRAGAHWADALKAAGLIPDPSSVMRVVLTIDGSEGARMDVTYILDSEGLDKLRKTVTERFEWVSVRRKVSDD